MTATFRPDDHPRGSGGQFTTKQQADPDGSVTLTDTDGQDGNADREARRAARHAVLDASYRRVNAVTEEHERVVRGVIAADIQDEFPEIGSFSVRLHDEDPDFMVAVHDVYGHDGQPWRGTTDGYDHWDVKDAINDTLMENRGDYPNLVSAAHASRLKLADVGVRPFEGARFDVAAEAANLPPAHPVTSQEAATSRAEDAIRTYRDGFAGDTSDVPDWSAAQSLAADLQHWADEHKQGPLLETAAGMAREARNGWEANRG